jgi:hypothetical protein
MPVLLENTGPVYPQAGQSGKTGSRTSEFMIYQRFSDWQGASEICPLAA